MRRWPRLLGFVLLMWAAATAFAQSAAVPKIKTIYVMPSSHWDLGFLAPPEEILPRLKPHIDEVIANCQADPEFRWTIESVWQVREWLARTPDPKQVDAFVRLVKSGQIQVSAVFGSMHTEFMGAEQLNRIAYDMKDLEKRLGIRSDFAMMNDVPGFTTRLPQVLAGSGVKYFVNGSNLFIGGGTALSPGKVPFYWQASDGSKVLTWQTQSKLGGYPEAMADYWLDPLSIEPYTKEHFYPKELAGKPPLEIMQAGVDKLLKKLDESGYPYDAVLLLYLHDFISSNWARDGLLPSVRAWNAAGRQPRIVVATPAEFFAYMESKYDGKFETHAGDWTGLWSEVKTNSPRISADARWAHDHLPVAESLWSLLTFVPGISFPHGNFEETRLKLLKYDEHSGSGQVGWPKLMSRAETDQQNREYVAYTSEARRDLQNLLDQGLQTLFSQEQQKDGAVRIVVYNPLSWERTNVVQVRLPQPARNLAIRDVATSAIIPSQSSGDRVEFLATKVPPFGYRTYVIAAGAAPAKAAAAAPTSLENEFYRIRVRPSDGAIVSIFDKQLGRDLLDGKGGFNRLTRWSFLDNYPVPIGKVSVSTTSGPLSSAITIRRPSSYWPETRLELPRGVKRIDLANRLDRSRMPYVASLQAGQNYSLDFPFAFAGSAALWVENGAGFHRLPQDYLPGARTDAAVPQHAVALEGSIGGAPAHVVLANRETFFHYIPALPGPDGKPVLLNTIRAQVIRKQDQGDTRDLGMVNFETVEPGREDEPVWASFSLSSAAGPLDAAATARLGFERNVPLQAAVLQPSMSPAKLTGSFFSLNAPNVLLLAFRPSADGDPNHYLLRLQEVAGRATDFELTTPLKVSSAEITSLTEERVLGVAPEPLRLRIGAHQTLTLRLNIPHETKQRSHRWWEW